jgi:hypothetical protein
VSDKAHDGLAVCFNVHLKPDRDEGNPGTPLVAFTNEGESGVNSIEIYYSRSTVTIRRFAKINGRWGSYDYHLFDPLFQLDEEKTIEFRAYFTTGFMYLVCNDGGKFLMSPLYFGLDHIWRYPDPNSNMFQFLNADNRAVIKVGDEKLLHGPYVSDVAVYGFNYEYWAGQMQRQFSSPSPAASICSIN